MAVTVDVFRRKADGKRGSPVTNAQISQLFQQPKHAPGFPGATQIVPLAIVAQTGGRYVVAPAPDQFNPSAFTLRASIPPSNIDFQDFGIRDGQFVEVRVGYER
jgi:hypothetical protein